MSIELKWDELDGRIRREYQKSDHVPFHFLKNSWEGLLSTFLAKKKIRICKAVIKTDGGFISKKKYKSVIWLFSCG